jgi:hypothetical protein
MGYRLRVDLTTGISQVEPDPASVPGPSQKAPVSALFFPEQAKKKAIDTLKHKLPGLDAQ